jgi:hypothetical protein
LQQLPAIDGPQAVTTGWTYLSVKDSAMSSHQAFVMPNLYSVNIAATNGPLNTSYPQWGIMRQMAVQYAPNSTFATIQHAPVAATLFQAGSDLQSNFWTLHMKNHPGNALAIIKMPQPVTSTLCKLNTILHENDTRPIQFPDTYVAGCLGDPFCAEGDILTYLNIGWGTTNYTGITRNQLWNQAKDSKEGRIIWVDNVRVKSPVNGEALGAIVVQPDFCESSANFTIKKFLTVSACVVGGVWSNLTTTLLTDPDSDSNAVLSVPASSIRTTTFGNMTEWSHDPVKMSKIWAESLNTVTDVQNRTVADNLLRWMPVTSNLCPLNGTYSSAISGNGGCADQVKLPDGSCPGDNENAYKRPFMHEALISSLVANGMSHAADGIELWTYSSGKDTDYRGWTFSNSRSDDRVTQNNPPGVLLNFHGRLPGYVFNLDGVPIKIALLILMLYCLVVVPYVLFTLTTGRSSRIWGTMSGFTALAINSTPTEALRNTSAGIDRVQTFRNTISVREVETNDRLELVFEKEEEKGGAYKRVLLGRGY